MRCPWHPHWLRALDRLEHDGRHPWQRDPAMRRGRVGLDASRSAPSTWGFWVGPMSRLSARASRAAWERAARHWIDAFTSDRGDINREWVVDPCLFRLLGPVRGTRVLDAGCGNGYLARILARRGARVTGVDQTQGLLDDAAGRERERPLGIAYRRGDLARMRGIRSGSFDAAVANVVMQDVRDLRGAAREIARVLRRGGRFLFSITHPCFEAPVPARKVRTPADSHRDEDWRMEVDDYFRRCAVSWASPGAPPIAGYHRPLCDYVDACRAAGLLVRRLEEPQPPPRVLRMNFRYFADQTRIPNFLVIEAVKPD